MAALTVAVAPNPVKIHEPTLIGEVTLKTRSMYRNRIGFPRSLISSGGLTAAPASATSAARWASTWLPLPWAKKASGAAAPATPPVKK